MPLAKPDEVGELARTGVVAADLREIKGFTARTAEGVAGISAPHILYIVTEASGVEDPIFEAIEGNMAGADARILLITNPTRRRGYFWDSHHKNKAQWHTFQLSSWAIAKSLKASGRTIPSLATERWCQERLEAWGKDDPRYKVRVLGEFVNLDEDKVIAPELLLEAEQRWATTITLDSDVLHVGVDPAGGGRDETACAPRRGQKVFPLQRWREADPDRNAALIYHFVLAQMAPDEVGALVKIDKGGEGWRVVAALNKLLDRVDPQRVRMRVIPIDFGWHPRRPAAYLRLRDEALVHLPGVPARWRGAAVRRPARQGAARTQVFRGRQRAAPRREQRRAAQGQPARPLARLGRRGRAGGVAARRAQARGPAAPRGGP